MRADRPSFRSGGHNLRLRSEEDFPDDASDMKTPAVPKPNRAVKAALVGVVREPENLRNTGLST